MDVKILQAHKYFIDYLFICESNVKIQSLEINTIP